MNLHDYIDILISRLNLPDGVEPTLEQLESEFAKYQSELAQIEKDRIDSLNSRLAQLSDHGILQACGITNPALHFINEVLNAEPELAEAEVSRLEQIYADKLAELTVDSWLESRKIEYAKIDDLLLEALAEQASGRPERMVEYLQLREQIKLQFPKPE